LALIDLKRSFRNFSMRCRCWICLYEELRLVQLYDSVFNLRFTRL
jgi:hypothetical protein